MAYASGLGATLAAVEETGGYGVVPSLAGIRGFEFDSESMKYSKEVRQGTGLRGAGGYPRARRRVVTAQSASGDITMDAVDKGLGFWLKQIMGAGAIAQIGATAAFRSTFTTADLRGRSFTLQIGKTDTSGATQPHTYPGCKITDFELGADNRDIAKLKVSIDALDEQVGVAYAAPDYTLAKAAEVFHHSKSGLFVAGSATPVTGNMKFTLKGSVPQNTERYHAGLNGFKAEPLENGWRSLTVDVDSEYIDAVTWAARKYTDETFALVALYEGPIITGATRSSLRVTLPAVKIDTADPNVDSTDVVKQPVTLSVVDNDVQAPVTIEYTTSDTLI